MGVSWFVVKLKIPMISQGWAVRHRVWLLAAEEGAKGPGPVRHAVRKHPLEALQPVAAHGVELTNAKVYQLECQKWFISHKQIVNNEVCSI